MGVCGSKKAGKKYRDLQTEKLQLQVDILEAQLQQQLELNKQSAAREQSLAKVQLENDQKLVSDAEVQKLKAQVNQLQEAAKISQKDCKPGQIDYNTLFKQAQYLIQPIIHGSVTINLDSSGKKAEPKPKNLQMELTQLPNNQLPNKGLRMDDLRYIKS